MPAFAGIGACVPSRVAVFCPVCAAEEFEYRPEPADEYT
jgi:hypothetical protein